MNFGDSRTSTHEISAAVECSQVVNASVYAMYDDMLEILLQENATGVINETVFTEGMASLDLTLQESLTALDYALAQNSLCQDLFEQVRGLHLVVLEGRGAGLVGSPEGVASVMKDGPHSAKQVTSK